MVFILSQVYHGSLAVVLHHDYTRPMRHHQTSDAFYLLAFFTILITAGAILLLLPVSWHGTGSFPAPLPWIDALFISTSAVCVTGLSSVDCSGFTIFGQTVIVLLIQLGGLGIISFTSLLIAIPGGRLPIRRLKTIQSFYLDSVEFNPSRIVRSIVFFTLIIEVVGAAALYPFFKNAGADHPLFVATFHSISAFCNAGFSTYGDNLEGFQRNIPVLTIISILIVSGGIGFIVLQDLERRLRGKRRRLSYHSKVVLSVTAFLIVGGATAFFLLERHHLLSGMSLPEAIVNSLFQSITPRTAGYNALPQAGLSQPSKVLTILLMFIGGAPGSIAGGIKVTTAFVIVIVMLRRPDQEGDIRIFRHRLTSKTTADAVVYFLKALALLAASAFALSLIEGPRGEEFSMLLFESVSAFGTVGLSLGLTPLLSLGGKLVIIATMFAGRVGLIALAFPTTKHRKDEVSYPEGSLLLG